MNQDFAEMPLEDEFVAGDEEGAPETVPVPRSLVPHLSESAILLDIDGTLLDLMPTMSSRTAHSLKCGISERGTGTLSGVSLSSTMSSSRCISASS